MAEDVQCWPNWTEVQWRHHRDYNRLRALLPIITIIGAKAPLSNVSTTRLPISADNRSSRQLSDTSGFRRLFAPAAPQTPNLQDPLHKPLSKRQVGIFQARE
jgi:hypothetical protein